MVYWSPFRESKFQIKIEDHCFDFGYNDPQGFMYLYTHTNLPRYGSLLQLMTTLRPQVVFKGSSLECIWIC